MAGVAGKFESGKFESCKARAGGVCFLTEFVAWMSSKLKQRKTENPMSAGKTGSAGSKWRQQSLGTGKTGHGNRKTMKNTCTNAEMSRNPEIQPTRALDKQSDGKSR